MKTQNRWIIAIAGVFLQIALGAVYAWSVFRVPLSKQFGWSISQVTLTFTISIFVLGFAAFFGGLWMNRKGPRVVALTAATLYGLGVFLASFSANKLWWLYLSYGFIGGLGLGLGYIVPVATLVKWFPDRRGLITGIAVGGFGAGAHHRASSDARADTKRLVCCRPSHISASAISSSRSSRRCSCKIRRKVGNRKDGHRRRKKLRSVQPTITFYPKR